MKATNNKDNNPLNDLISNKLFSSEDKKRLKILSLFIFHFFYFKKNDFFSGTINLVKNNKNIAKLDKYQVAIHKILYFIDLTLFLRTGFTIFRNKGSNKFLFRAYENGSVIPASNPINNDKSIPYQYFSKLYQFVDFKDNEKIPNELLEEMSNNFDKVEIDTILRVLGELSYIKDTEALIEMNHDEIGWIYFSSLPNINKNQSNIIQYDHPDVIWRYRKSLVIRSYLITLGFDLNEVFIYKDEC